MKKIIGWILVIGFFVFVFRGSLSNDSSTITKTINYNDYDYSSLDNNLSRDEAIDSYWDEISEYVDGTETIEACSDESGNCYDLDADISNGHLETLYFNNGGYLSFYTDFDSDGDAYDTDDEGRGWSFRLDMDSSMIDDAVTDWASDNDYTIE
jgi:hypothetical protein